MKRSGRGGCRGGGGGGRRKIRSDEDVHKMTKRKWKHKNTWGHLLEPLMQHKHIRMHMPEVHWKTIY